MITHYLKIVLRDINKNKLRYLLTTLGIAVGIAIFSLMHFLVDIPNLLTSLPDDKNLYDIVESVDGQRYRSGVPLPILKKVQEESINEIEHFAFTSGFSFGNYAVNLEDEDIVFLTTQLDVNRDFFSVTSAEFIHGNANSWGNREQAIITEKMADKLFGKEYPIGKRIQIQGGLREHHGSYTVAGVIKPIHSTDFNADIYLEWQAPEDKQMHQYHRVSTLIKLKKGASPIEVNKTLKNMTLLNKDFEDYWTYGDNAEVFLEIVHIKDKNDYINTTLRAILLLLAATVLIIALFNFFNLLITSVQSRIRQFTLHKVVGANHWTLLAMLIIEIIPVLSVALLISYSFIELFMTWMKNNFIASTPAINVGDFIFPKVYNYPLIITGWTLLICILVAIILTYRIQKMVLMQGIRGKAIKSHRNIMRNTLIFFQLLFTLIFLSTAVEFSRAGMDSLWEVNETLSEAQGKAVFELHVANVYRLKDHSEELLSRVKQVPGVDMAVSFDGFWGLDSGETLSNSGQFSSTMLYSPEFFEGYQQFYELETPLPHTLAPDEVIVNEKLANYLNEQGETTLKLNMYNKTYKIAGIIPHIPYTKTDSYAALVPPGTKIHNAIMVKCNPENAKSVHKQLMLLVRDYVPETIPYEITSLYERTKQRNMVIHSAVKGLSIATLMSLLLTVFGIFTAVNADTKLRRKEIAIRKINGATYRDVLWKYLKLYTITLIAVLIASIPLYLIAVKMLEVPFTNKDKGVGSLVISWIFTSAIVLLTVFKQIRQAAGENPADVIKSE